MKKIYASIFSTTLFALVLLVSGCNKFDSEGTIDGEYIGDSSIEQENKINYPVYISQNIETEIAAAIAKRTQNRVNSTDLAKIAFINDNELTEELAENFCDSNKVLVLLNPSDNHIGQFTTGNEDCSEILFAAYNADGEHCAGREHNIFRIYERVGKLDQ